MNVSTSEPLSVDQVRILLAEGVDLCARYASSKLTVLDDDCDPDALQRRYGGTLQCSCPRVFDSVRDFEGHYANRHRLACVQCHTSLPTVHLLELHIAESHDPLFAAADRLKYQCVVEGCVERFASVSDRKQHAVEVHRYPAGFAYFPPLPPQEKPKARPVLRGSVPRSVCFGRGSSVAWHQQRSSPASYQRSQDINMRDIAEALDS
ncbi:zinc finger protein 511 lethal (2) k10201 isoform X3 [Amblyomma americanum]